MSVAIPPDPDFTAYARNRDEAAFRRLVKTHLGMVRRTALRTLHRHPHLSDDVAQAVFLRLAKKASALPPDLCLPMWLHQQAVWIARNTERTETRRRAREKTAHIMNEEADHAAFAPPQLEPWVDTALLALPPRDREAILLRYFQNLSFHQVGAAMGITADTAQKRVSRALDRLRVGLTQGLKMPLTHGAVIAFLLVEGKAQAAVPPLLAGSISAHALAAKPGVVSQILTIMTTSSKAIFIGAAAGSLIAAMPLLSSAFPNAKNDDHGGNPGDNGALSSGNVSPLPRANAFAVPAPGKTGKELLEQVKLILSGPPDTELTRARLEAYLDQLDAAQCAALFAEAGVQVSDTIAEALFPSLFERWVLQDGPGAMIASLPQGSVRLAGSGYDLSRVAYDSWLNHHFDEAQQWLVENQKNPAWDQRLPWMVGMIAKGYAARDLNQFVAWVREIQGDDLRDSAIRSAVRGLEDKDKDSKQDEYRRLFDLLKAQENPAIVHDALMSFLSQSARRHGLEAEMAREVARLPRSTDLLWELMKSNTEKTLKGMSEEHSRAQVEAMVSDILHARKLTEYAESKLHAIRLDPEKLAPFLTGQDREDLLGHMAALTSQAGNYDEDSSWESLRWTAQIADESRRSDLTREILKVCLQRNNGVAGMERLKERPLHSLPPEMRRMVEAAADAAH